MNPKQIAILSIKIINPDAVVMMPENDFVYLVIRSARWLAKRRHRELARIAWQTYYRLGIARLFGETLRQGKKR